MFVSSRLLPKAIDARWRREEERKRKRLDILVNCDSGEVDELRDALLREALVICWIIKTSEIMRTFDSSDSCILTAVWEL